MPHVVDSDGKVKIERNCLSLLMSKNLKLKKVIKSFVPEPISCFSDSYINSSVPIEDVALKISREQ